MLPLFKSHYSIGKSILTLSPPDQVSDGGADSVFQIASEEGLDKVILIEDAPAGFLEAKSNAEALGIQLVFGLRLKLSTNGDDSIHKVIVFAKDDQGCILLNNIYSKVFCEFNGVGNYNLLKEYWNDDHLRLCVPFYDSFLFHNTLMFANCMPELSFCDPVFFIERNGLPFDDMLEDKVLKYCEAHDHSTELAKTIYYKSRDDLESYQTYKCVCNRRFGRARSLSNPGFDHLGSREFCFESWKECVNEQ